ncbi:MAG: mevalonate kinase, partial [Oligoflexia bacterium]|nr:mevalonate kinase [Oligoflexia bacterium]
MILFGEHAVVYGHPAIAAAVNRGTTVSLQPEQGPTTVHAADIEDARLDAAIAAILPAQGLGVRLSTDLPVGRGMGSSAALAVALVRANAAWEGRVADLGECIRQGFVVERIFHGTPSGIDHTVSARGGAVYFRRGKDGPALSPAKVAPLTLVVLDSGVTGNTKALVAAVRA